LAQERCKKKLEKLKKANIAQDGSDSKVVLLMATTCEGNPLCEDWYLDSGCSNHMTGHREWLINFDSTRKQMLGLQIAGTLSQKVLVILLSK
jgi:hypothetical protein